MFYSKYGPLCSLASFLIGACVNATPLTSVTIEMAGGGLPNTTLPRIITTSGTREIQLAQFLENLEVSFFTQGVVNISSWGTSGYRNDSTKLLSRIAAQEEVHLESLATLLTAYNAPQIPPCKYSFPVNSTKDLLLLARLIGSASVSAAIGISERLALSDPLLSRLLSSISTVESRHDATIRHMQGGVPNPAPYDTGSTSLWAYNMAHSFIIPGSCPVTLPIPLLPQLGVVKACSNSTQGAVLLEFTWDPTQRSFLIEEGKELLIGWVNQLNVPVYTQLNITSRGRGISRVPQGIHGSAFAVISTQRYNSVHELSLGTLAGPAFTMVS